MSVIDQVPDELLAVPGFCPAYHHAIELIGRRWSGVIIRAMIHGATRFSDISAAIPGISDRLISERRALGDVVAAVAAWAETWCAPAADEEGCSG